MSGKDISALEEIKKYIYGNLGGFVVGESNCSETRETIAKKLSEYLSRVWSHGWEVICDETNNNPEVIDIYLKWSLDEVRRKLNVVIGP